MRRLRKFVPLILLGGFVLISTSACIVSGPNGGPASVPKIDVSVNPTGPNDNLSSTLQLFLLLTLLSVAPAIILLMTSFTRTVIVLSLVRSAIGIPTLPPNQVIVGLALFLTFFIMAPVWKEAKETALDPLFKNEITLEVAQTKVMAPVRTFMFRQTRQRDLALFIEADRSPAPQTPDDIPNQVILPAFVLSELKTAFQMGFMLFLPFLVIDLVVAAILMSMGMMLVSPAAIALPFKLLLFVLVDGWYLVVQSLLNSYK